MIFQSTYFTKRLFLKLIAKCKWHILSLFIISILIVSSINNPHPIELGGRKKSLLELGIDAIYGLPYYGLTQLVFSIIIFTGLALMLYGYLYSQHKKLKMIVGIVIDLQKDQLILVTKDLLDGKMKSIFKLSTIRLREDICKDRIGTSKFNCFIFVSKNLAIGRLFVNHFTWNNIQEIDKIKSYFEK